MLVEFGVFLARAARDFFKDFDVLAAENPIFSLASQGWRHKRLRVWGRGSSLIFSSVELEVSGS